MDRIHQCHAGINSNAPKIHGDIAKQSLFISREVGAALSYSIKLIVVVMITHRGMLLWNCDCWQVFFRKAFSCEESPRPLKP